MEEVKQIEPQTELEYWMEIESLGGFIWQMNHDLSHGRIQDPEGKIDLDIIKCRARQARLVEEIGEKFGVIHPKDCPRAKSGEEVSPAPEDKVYYWDWYNRMKMEAYKVEYAKIICSACPFCEGAEKMMSLGGTIPCSVFSGVIYYLSRPYVCAMVGRDNGDWTKKDLYREIRKKGGFKTLRLFKKKERELQSISE